MLKKSKVVALLVVCMMMFAAVEPALAWGNRTGSQAGDAAVYGTGAGAAAAGLAAAALIFFTGGLATPIVIGAAAAGAAGGAYYGYSVEEKTLAKDVGVLAGAGAGGGVVAVAAPIVAGTLTVGEAVTTASIGLIGLKEYATEAIMSAKQSATDAVNSAIDEVKKDPVGALKSVATSTVAKDIAEDFAQEALEEIFSSKESPKKASTPGNSKNYTTVHDVKETTQLLETFDSSKYDNVRKFENELQDLANRGRKVIVFELKKDLDKLTVTYAVDNIVYVKKFDL